MPEDKKRTSAPAADDGRLSKRSKTTLPAYRPHGALDNMDSRIRRILEGTASGDAEDLREAEAEIEKTQRSCVEHATVSYYADHFELLVLCSEFNPDHEALKRVVGELEAELTRLAVEAQEQSGALEEEERWKIHQMDAMKKFARPVAELLPKAPGGLAKQVDALQAALEQTKTEAAARAEQAKLEVQKGVPKRK